MTDTNWPDPKRPGVPLFPERDGWHMLDRDVWQWSAKRKAWNDTILHPNFVLPKNMAWRKYYGPVITPTQINEMLAAERERAATAIDQLKNEERGLYATGLMTTRAEITIRALASAADEIRNLGAAP